jgi:hypothetical protein
VLEKSPFLEPIWNIAIHMFATNVGALSGADACEASGHLGVLRIRPAG